MTSSRLDAASRLDATVVGIVQGVGFRVFVLGIAHELGLTGWVANVRAGAVRCVAEGDRATLGRLLEELGRGPVASIVDEVREVWMPATGEFEGFSVRSGWHSGD
jgi:acylphosphatase